MDITFTETQTPVLLSKAHELEFIGQCGVGKTFTGLSKIIMWLQDNPSRTGFFVVSNRYASKNIEKLISCLWSSLGVYRFSDKSFNLYNKSILFIVSKSELNCEALGGAERGSFVLDADIESHQYNFALCKTAKDGFILQCTLGEENALIERTNLIGSNPYLV